MTAFEELKERAKIYAASPHMPRDLQGQLASVLILLDLADQKGLPFWDVIHGMMVFQGKLAPKAEYLIACATASGELEDTIHYENDWDKMRSRARAVSAKTGKDLVGSWVSMEMAQAEGWTRNPKYKKSDEMAMHMLDLRAAAFFCRKFGLNPFGGMVAEEVEDVGHARGDKAAPAKPVAPIVSAKDKPQGDEGPADQEQPEEEGASEG